ncbi:MAG: chromate transporter [Bacteroidota bacterium]|nr:chromate transporter [Bacteroidota bacterium]
MNNISFKEAFLFWLKLGFISFGGPAGQIAIMHQHLVEKKKWISESKFLHALNYCMLLPGPEAQQLATYTGWLMHGTLGGITAGLLFILPSVFILLGLSIMYVTYGQLAIVTGIFDALKPAVAAIVFLALWKIASKALKHGVDYLVAITALVALLFFKVPYPLVIIGAILVGVVYVNFFQSQGKTTETSEKTRDDEIQYTINRYSNIPHTKFSIKRFALQATLFIVLWVIPFILFNTLSSDFKFWNQFSLFFTKSAFFTFGGAYSVLMYVAQFAVQKLHWLTQAQMVDGLALGETTPGPLIMVLTFVGFMGAFQHFNGSLVAASMGLLITTYYTFFPSFVFVLLGAPVIERTQENQSVKLILGFVTAAVVGVIANLTIFTAQAVLFPNSISFAQLNWFALIWIAISIIAMKRFNINMILWIAISALAGILKYFLLA